MHAARAVAASAPDVSAVVPPAIDASSCSGEIELDGNHFRPGLLVGVASNGSCGSDWFATGDGKGEYCVMPVDSVTWTKITFHFDSCLAAGTHSLAIVNPDHDLPATGSSGQLGQVGYARLTIQ